MNNIDKHHRHSIRLREFDYSRPGAYFATFCTHNREQLLGQIFDGEMVPNVMGQIVEKEVRRSSEIRQNIYIDKYVIMPNHIHLIVIIKDVGANGHSPGMSNAEIPRACRYDIDVGAIHELPLHGRKPHRNMILPKMIGRIKMNCAKRINVLRNSPGHPVRQRNYYEHVIRDERELNKIRRYIINNPPKWEYDWENQNGIPIDDKKQFWNKFLFEF